jgi:hypothetical protein
MSRLRAFSISFRTGSAAGLVLATSGSFALAAACGANPDYAPGGGAGAGSSEAGAGFELGFGGSENASGGAPSATQLALEVTAEQQELEAAGEPVSLQLTARYEDGSRPKVVVWTVDDTRIGSVSEDGEFTANGFVGGDVTITATVGSQSASLTIHVTVTIVSDPDGLETSLKDELVTGGSDGPGGVGPDGELRFLYPYDETVFPRGLFAPLLQLGGAEASATYVKISTSNFSYEAFAGASGPTRVTLSEDVWRGVTLSAGAGDWVEVEVTKESAGEVTGPVAQRWLIAQGSLKGFVFYNTYRSPLAATGAVMRIKPGETATVLQRGCTVCHSVSAQGNVLVAGVQWDGENAVVSRAFNLPENGGITLRNEQADGRVYAFGGLTPDGALMLTSGVPASGAKMRGMSGELFTRLVDTATGETVPAPSFGVNVAMTPNFSPDGSRVAFNNHDASAAGHVLSVASFDGSAEPPEFGEVSNLVTDAEKVLAWPSFLPDASALLFHAGDSFDTAGYQGGPLYADLRLVDIESGGVSTLDALNGYTPDGELYLPAGEAQEAHLNYEPSVLPVPVGGYYWVLFTSRRTYGNTIAPGGTLPRGDDIWGVPQGEDEETPSPRKKIWVAAIDVDHQAVADPSHPAFYLPGQELESGNMRAFAAFEPCKKRGKGCESAAECCDGFCRETGRDDGGAPVLECMPPPDNSCANIDEACAVAGDCCTSKALCINKRCAAPTPQPK